MLVEYSLNETLARRSKYLQYSVLTNAARLGRTTCLQNVLTGPSVTRLTQIGLDCLPLVERVVTFTERVSSFLRVERGVAFVDGGEVERGPGDTTRELQHRGYIRQWKKQTRLVPQTVTLITLNNDYLNKTNQLDLIINCRLSKSIAVFVDVSVVLVMQGNFVMNRTLMMLMRK